MTILRTICPHCDIVRVKAGEATLRHADHESHVEVGFTCPGCANHVVQQLNARMLPLLISAGCLMADDHLSIDLRNGAITEAEIDEFVAGLERLDWADELAY